ncbi:DNA phosphorothioation-dependent restriction protein DptG, partial [Staphylococcus condimenti]
MNEEEKQKFLLNIFDYSHLKSFKHPYLINYLTLSDGNEKRGEVDVAKFIVQLFKLKSNQQWHEFVENKSTSNLVEKLLISSLNEIEEKDADNNFIITLKDVFEVRHSDLNYLLKHKDFAIKNLNLFFAFYYFQYLMQTALNVDRFNIDKQNMYKLYYTLDTEKITSTRVTNQRGFNLIRNLYKNLLPNDNLLGYLNELIEKDTFYTLDEIKQLPENEKESLNNELRTFLLVYKNTTNKDEDISYILEN